MSAGNRQNYLRHFLLIGAFSAVAMLPAYYSGIPGGNDQYQHYQFASTVYNAISSGDIYPSVAGATNHGFGDVGLRFYPPLMYYALSTAYFLTHDWYFASLLTFTIVFFVGGVGIFFWAREEFEAQTALIAAALYVFAPYHLNQLYNNALFAEFFAMAFVPFCYLFLTRVCRKGTWLSVFGLALSYALLILSHLPLTIICSIALGFYGIVLLQKKNIWANAAKLVVALCLAIIMTAFYWSRWIPELAWLKHSSPEYFSSIWNYRSNFLLLPSHFLNRDEDIQNLWLADLFLIVMLLSLIPTVLFFIRDKNTRTKFVTSLLVVLTVGLFMTTQLSGIVWDKISVLQKVQFPWRWLAVITAFGAVFASMGIDRAATLMKSDRRRIFVPIGLGAILVLYIFTSAFVTKGASYTSRSELNKMMQTIPESEGCECWWPVWADRSAFIQSENVEIANRNVNITNWSTLEKTFHIAAGESRIATVKTFYYPRWHADINSSPAQVDNNAHGLVSLFIPADETDVRLTFAEPEYVAAANVVSLTAWLILLISAVVLLLRSCKQVLLVS
jgi:6-pyruvoyl-tetrahydropterin synthase related domain